MKRIISAIALCILFYSCTELHSEEYIVDFANKELIENERFKYFQRYKNRDFELIQNNNDDYEVKVEGFPYTAKIELLHYYDLTDGPPPGKYGNFMVNLNKALSQLDAFAELELRLDGLEQMRGRSSTRQVVALLPKKEYRELYWRKFASKYSKQDEKLDDWVFISSSRSSYYGLARQLENNSK